MFLDLLQQPRGVLDFVADVAGVYGSWLSRCALERPPGDGGDLIEIAFQRGFRCCFPLALFRLEKQLRLGENPLAGLPGSGIAPGVVEQLGLPRGPVLLREDLRHPLTLLAVDARHRSQIPHGDLRGDTALADLLLHGFRQCVHQRQPSCDPTRATVEAQGQFFDRVAVLGFHLGQQPALFERTFRFAMAAQRMNQQQGFDLAHRVPNQRVDGVAPQLLQRGDALVAIDNQIFLPAGNHDNRRLLAGFSQRRQQLPESRRVAGPEMLQAAVQLMKLERLRHGFQYARVADWSFPGLSSYYSEPFSDQWDRWITGLLRIFGVVRRQVQ